MCKNLEHIATNARLFLWLFFTVLSRDAVITIEVSALTKTNPAFYVLIGGTEKVLGDTFTLAPDLGGNGVFTVWISPLDRGDHGTCNLQLQITATSAGIIGTPDVESYTKTV